MCLFINSTGVNMLAINAISNEQNLRLVACQQVQ